MKKLQYTISHTTKISPAARAAIEKLATRREISLGEATRITLNKGIEALKLNA